MSQYMRFFAYPNSIGSTFIQIDAFSRNNVAYQIANQAIAIPYEAIAYISKDNLQKCIDITQGYIASKKETIANYNKKIDIISKFNNTVEEKLTAIDDCYICLRECEEELNELLYTENFFITLYGISASIYAGIECGSEVTINDIKQEDKEQYKIKI